MPGTQVQFQGYQQGGQTATYPIPVPYSSTYGLFDRDVWETGLPEALGGEPQPSEGVPWWKQDRPWWETAMPDLTPADVWRQGQGEIFSTPVFGTQGSIWDYGRGGLLTDPKYGGGNAELYLGQLYDRQAEIQAALDRATALGAEHARVTYQMQLDIINREIADTKEMLLRNQTQWEEWRKATITTIGDAAARAEQAYGEYMRLINAGYDEYEAKVRSRFDEYQAEVQRLISDYMGATNESYGDLMRQIPEIYRPVTRAIAEDEKEAIAAIQARREQYESSVEGQITAATTMFSDHMERIGADNPALADQLLGEVRMIGEAALSRVDQHLDWREAAQPLIAKVARTAAQFEVSSRLLGLEQERFQAINEARRTQEMLLARSDTQMEAALEASEFSRVQALTSAQSQLEQYLQELDLREIEVLRDGALAQQSMEYELTEALQTLLDEGRITQAEYDLAMKEIQAQASLPWTIDLPAYAGGAMASALHEFGFLPARENELLEAINAWTQEGAEGIYVSMEDALGKQIDSPYFEATAEGWTQFVQWVLANPHVELGELYTSEEVRAIWEAFRARDRALTEYESTPFASMQSISHPLGQGTWRITGHFGDPRDGGRRTHGGVDMTAPTGTPVHAYGGGTVHIWQENLGGICVSINHGNGVVTKYMHLKERPPLEEGQYVAAGEVIGLVGATGNAEGPHLHFSVVVNGKNDNPMNWLTEWYGSA